WSCSCRSGTRADSFRTTAWSASCAFPTRRRSRAAMCSAASWCARRRDSPRWKRSTGRSWTPRWWRCSSRCRPSCRSGLSRGQSCTSRRLRGSRGSRLKPLLQGYRVVARRCAAGGCAPPAGGPSRNRGPRAYNAGMPASFLFYDLETFGADPRRTRIAQFAAIRTDESLNEIEEPIDFLVRPADDLLPSPDATMVTGLPPQRALAEGVPEAEAFARIFEEMSRPQTCTLGYNSLRFDDEFVRYGLYRNFHDPYEREWRGGNCRWDLLDVLRLMHA